MTKYIAPWRKQLLPGSFRNVPFFVKSAQTQVGRRVVIHEYAQRDEAYPEDMGRKADAFTVEAIVIGPDYIRTRDALIAALKQRGPGVLVHPYYGQRTVALSGTARISETPEEGGVARFTLEFVEAGENAEPSAHPDTQEAVEVAADEAQEVIAEDFTDSFSVDGAPEFVEVSALDQAREAMNALDAARRAMVPDLSVLSDYMAAANGVAGSLNSLIRAPAAFAQNILGMFGALKALAKGPLHAFNAYKGLFGYGSRSSGSERMGASRTLQVNNQAAITTLTRRAALIEAARVASRASYDTYEQAVAMRGDLAARLDDEAAGLTPGYPDVPVVPVPEAVYQALTALRVAVVRDLSTRAVDAPRIASATMPATLPALVVAYRIHGDAQRADEIVSRNPTAIRHPGFVPGGRPLEIVSR